MLYQRAQHFLTLSRRGPIFPSGDQKILLNRLTSESRQSIIPGRCDGQSQDKIYSFGVEWNGRGRDWYQGSIWLVPFSLIQLARRAVSYAISQVCCKISNEKIVSKPVMTSVIACVI